MLRTTGVSAQDLAEAIQHVRQRSATSSRDGLEGAPNPDPIHPERLVATSEQCPHSLSDPHRRSGPRISEKALLQLDFTTLRFFVSVTTEGSIARAAKKENISPSAVSKRISDAEAALGVTLFERAPRGLLPTPAAMILLRHAQRILRDMQVLDEDLKEYIRGGEGIVRVASTMTAVCQYLPTILRDFSTRYPRIEFEIEEMNSADIVEAVRDRQNEIGFAFWQRSDPELKIIPFVTDQLGVIMPAGHQLSERETLWFHEILPYNLVGMRSGSDLQRRLELEAARSEKPLRLHTRVGSFDAAFQLVGAGLGLAVIPVGYMGLLGDPDRFHAAPLMDSWAVRRLNIVVSRRRPLSEPARLLVEAIRTGIGADT